MNTDDYEPIEATAARWQLSLPQTRKLVRDGRVPGAYRDITKANAPWMVPKDSPKPGFLQRGPKPSSK